MGALLAPGRAASCAPALPAGGARSRPRSARQRGRLRLGGRSQPGSRLRWRCWPGGRSAPAQRGPRTPLRACSVLGPEPAASKGRRCCLLPPAHVASSPVCCPPIQCHAGRQAVPRPAAPPQPAAALAGSQLRRWAGKGRQAAAHAGSATWRWQHLHPRPNLPPSPLGGLEAPPAARSPGCSPRILFMSPNPNPNRHAHPYPPPTCLHLPPIPLITLPLITTPYHPPTCSRLGRRQRGHLPPSTPHPTHPTCPSSHPPAADSGAAHVAICLNREDLGGYSSASMPFLRHIEGLYQARKSIFSGPETALACSSSEGCGSEKTARRLAACGADAMRGEPRPQPGVASWPLGGHLPTTRPTNLCTQGRADA